MSDVILEEVVKEDIIGEHVQDGFYILLKIDFWECRIVSVSQKVENSVKDGEELILEHIYREGLEFWENFSEAIFVVVEGEQFSE